MGINYNGTYYEIRYANHNKAGIVRFGSERLRTALIDINTGNYKGEVEKRIGEALYGFLPVKLIRSGTDAEIDQYVNEHFA